MTYNALYHYEITESAEMLEVFSYTELNHFLRDAWLSKKSRNQSFSLTAWSKQLGFENSSPLSLALKGKRNLPKKYLPQVIKSLDLSTHEAQYLEGLFDSATAKTPEERLFYFQRLEQLSPRKIKDSTVDESETISDPVYGLILEMTALPDFKTDPYWIQKRMRIPMDIYQISEVIERLMKLGLLHVEPQSKKYKKKHQDIFMPNDISQLAAKEYHKSVSLIGSKEVFSQSIEQREFQSFSFNLKEQCLPKAKEKIRHFLQEFLTEFEASDQSGDETYQLSVQLFSLTK